MDGGELRGAGWWGRVWTARLIASEHGYTLHRGRKLRIRRRHQRQLVTGLVVNERVSLARETRQWLRAVEHHWAEGRPSTVSRSELAGWRAFRAMIERG